MICPYFFALMFHNTGNLKLSTTKMRSFPLLVSRGDDTSCCCGNFLLDRIVSPLSKKIKNGTMSGFAMRATITVDKFAKNCAKNTRNVTKLLLQNFLQFCNVTISCIGYFL